MSHDYVLQINWRWTCRNLQQQWLQFVGRTESHQQDWTTSTLGTKYMLEDGITDLWVFLLVKNFFMVSLPWLSNDQIAAQTHNTPAKGDVWTMPHFSNHQLERIIIQTKTHSVIVWPRCYGPSSPGGMDWFFKGLEAANWQALGNYCHVLFNKLWQSWPSGKQLKIREGSFTWCFTGVHLTGQ